MMGSVIAMVTRQTVSGLWLDSSGWAFWQLDERVSVKP